MGIREGLLTLLAQGPRYGYQLKVELEAATGAAWTVNVGQIYSTLQRLERDGAVAQEGADDEGRVRYRVTDAGRAEAKRWFDTPVTRDVAARDEVAMKIKLALSTHAVSLDDVLRSERNAAMRALQDYTSLKAAADGSDLAWLIHLDRLVYLTEAELRWLDLIEERTHDLPRLHTHLLDDVPSASAHPQETPAP
ncbi:MAG: helix-turn-helix transcriptional regulator [Acidimicrobiales bacterium]|nr:helix-turn-helix transcriptional regulator [Acidimicrobiales bacterium]